MYERNNFPGRSEWTPEMEFEVEGEAYVYVHKEREFDVDFLRVPKSWKLSGKGHLA